MGKQKRTKPPPIRPKEERWPPPTSELQKKHIEDLANAEYEDWAHDCEMREWKRSEDYKVRKDLADRFKRKK